MSKTFEVAIKINGELGNLMSAANAAQRALGGLGRGAARSAQQASRATQNLQGRLAQLQRNAANAAQFRNLNATLGDFGKQTAQAKLKSQELLRQYQAQEKQVEQMRANFERLQNARRENPRDVRASTVRDARAELRTQEAALKDMRTQYQNADRVAQSLNTELRAQTSQLSQLQSAFNSAGVGAENLASHERDLQRSIESTNRQLQFQQQRDLANEAGQNLSNAYANFQGSLDTAQTIMSPFKGAIEDAITFEKKASQLKAISQMDLIREGNLEQANANMKTLTDQAKLLGRTTVKTSSEVLDAQYYLAKTGMQTEKIAGSVEPLLKLSVMSDMDFGSTADIVTNIAAGFGHGTDQIAHDANALAYATSHSNSDLRQLGESMKYAAPVAKQFGSSIEETAAMLGFMHDAGIQGSAAGTSLRMTMLRLMKPPTQTTKALQENSLTVADATKEWENAQQVAASYGVTLDETLKPGAQMASIIEQIDKNMAGLSGHEKMAAFAAITGVNAVSGATTMFDRGADALKKQTEALRMSDGSLDVMYKTSVDNAWGALQSFKSAKEGLSQEIGEVFLLQMRGAFDSLAQFTNGLTGFVNQNPQVVAALGAIAAGISAVIVGASGIAVATAGFGFVSAQLQVVSAAAQLAKFRMVEFFAAATAGSSANGAVNAIRNLGTAFLSAGRAAMGFAISPIGAALMAIALAGLFCYTNWDRVAPVFEQLGGVISNLASSVMSTLGPAFSNLADTAVRLAPTFAMAGGVIFGVVATIANVIIRLGAMIIQTFANAIAFVVNAVSNLGQVISHLIEGDFSGAWDAFTNGAIQAKDDVVQIFSGIGDGVIDTFSHFFDPIKTLLGDAPEASGGGTVGTPSAAPVDAGGAANAVAELGNASSQAAQNTADFAQNVQANASAADTLNQSITGIGDGAALLQQNLAGMGEGFTALNTAVPTTATELTNVGTAAQTTSPQVTQLGADASAASAGLQQISGAATSAASGLGQISGAAGSVASALSAKASEIASIHISAPTVSAAPVAANAKGGIYPRGAFLTTFAEKSPEAAIPLDNSSRAKTLWQMAGQALGLLPGSPKLDSPNFDAADKIFAQKLPKPNLAHKVTFPAQKIFNSSGSLQADRVQSPQLNSEMLPTAPANDITQAAMPPINISITINGSANAQDIQSASQSLAVSLTDKLNAWWRDREHELQRRSF